MEKVSFLFSSTLINTINFNVIGLTGIGSVRDRGSYRQFIQLSSFDLKCSQEYENALRRVGAAFAHN